MMVALKTLIVDDEPVSRQILREELEQFNEVSIIGEAEDGGSALTSIAALRPDLVYLDLQMPGLGGFDVIRKLKFGQNIPVIVVVTAFDQYAIQAFEAGAIDYLLKPVGHERLANSIDRASKLHSRPILAAEQLAQMQEIAESTRLKFPRRIVARNGEEVLLLNVEEVFAFEAEGDVVWVITAKKRYRAMQSLKLIQEKLEKSSFRRIHRNALVNTDHIRKISVLTSQRRLITLSNSQEFIVSKRQARTIRELLSW